MRVTKYNSTVHEKKYIVHFENYEKSKKTIIGLIDIIEAQKEKIKRLNEIAKKVNLPLEEVEPSSLLFTTDIDDAIA